MMNILQNDNLTICVKARGAELCSVRSVEGTEYIWHADPSVWGKHSPILFPAVGRMVNNQYRYNGKTYDMPKHGFARDSEFTLIDRSDSRLVFELTDNAQTLACWPFRFQFRVSYTLSDHTLTVGFEVANPNAEEMLFSLGAHPAFACPLEEGLEFSDYV
ncbi:MAG: aldose epimerase family protein, partial [Planctomycetota bacterium]